MDAIDFCAEIVKRGAGIAGRVGFQRSRHAEIPRFVCQVSQAELPFCESRPANFLRIREMNWKLSGQQARRHECLNDRQAMYAHPGKPCLQNARR